MISTSISNHKKRKDGKLDIFTLTMPSRKVKGEEIGALALPQRPAKKVAVGSGSRLRRIEGPGSVSAETKRQESCRGFRHPEEARQKRRGRSSRCEAKAVREAMQPVSTREGLLRIVVS